MTPNNNNNIDNNNNNIKINRWQRIKHKLSEILHHKDPPHKLALGVAIGMFVGMLPIMGIQMLAVTIVALPFRANLKVAVAMVWISNPITFIPLYWLNYQFGLLFMPNMRISWDEFAAVLTKASDWNWSAIEDSFSNLVGIGANVMIPLWLGSSILGLILGAFLYFIVFRWIVFYRKKLVHKQ